MRYTRPCMLCREWRLWVAAVVSAALLELSFPLAGPLPEWRTVFAWIGFVPLLWAVLTATQEQSGLRKSFLLAYVCGVLWYVGNCYWIYDTMLLHGGLSPLVSALLLLGFSLVLGAYFGFFGLGVALVRRATGSTRLALASAPVLWVALELAGARITCVPWDQLGYSQVDNALLTRLAPWTGVYGISFVLVVVNALVAGGLTLTKCRGRRISAIAGVVLMFAGTAGLFVQPPLPPATATAVLVQPNLDVSANNDWMGASWNQHLAQFDRMAHESCKSWIAGIPQTGAPVITPVCPQPASAPALVAWPESPAPFFDEDPRFMRAMGTIARDVQAPLVVNAIGSGGLLPDGGEKYYVSAVIIGSDGQRVGRYDKIHLVPFGEYIPFQNLLFFAHKLTGRVSSFSRGEMRTVFRLNGHRYGVFICYEAVFADEVRQFARLGAEVLLNISDDGWYGDTSAPWQHLNMARMRAVENHRWLLRDTNNGVTCVIDPYGRVRQSISRHAVDALPAAFGYCDDTTFYTEHGDVFAWLCAILAISIAGWSARRLLNSAVVWAKQQSR